MRALSVQVIAEGVKVDEKVQAKLRKLLALAERGVGGEKETAQRMLEKMLARHGLTMDSLVEDQRSLVWFKFACKNERRLGRQLAAKVLDSRDSAVYGLYASKDRPRQFGVKLSPAEAVEFELLYDVLRKALAAHLETAYQAFVQANGIFPSSSSDDPLPALSDEDFAIIAMASVTTPTEVNKRIAHTETLAEPNA